MLKQGVCSKIELQVSFLSFFLSCTFSVSLGGIENGENDGNPPQTNKNQSKHQSKFPGPKSNMYTGPGQLPRFETNGMNLTDIETNYIEPGLTSPPVPTTAS